MAKFIKIPESETAYQLQFMCPGCKSTHAINNKWNFNGDFDKPTVEPSVLVTWDFGELSGIKKRICHSFIRGGKIQFLDDCTHDLSGTTVDLPEINL